MKKVFMYLAVVSIICAVTCAYADVKSFSEEIEQILHDKIKMIEILATDKIVLKAVKESNLKNKGTSLVEIIIQDKRWQNTVGINEFIKSFIINECAQHLLDYQEINDEFPEIFISDERGLIVAETNRTSDYYQADEAWWINTYNNGQGKSGHGEIEYDESARAEAIAIYAPVMDPESNKAIGIIKAVCDITAIKMEL